MRDYGDEKVLVFDSNQMDSFTTLGDKNKISRSNKDVEWFRICVNRSYFILRNKAEGNPAFKQIIPYVVFKHKGKFLTYCRRSGGDPRLENKFSVGVGGHVNPCDFHGSLEITIVNAAKREVREELNLEREYDEGSAYYKRYRSYDYLIYDPSDNVGMDHFGVVHDHSLSIEEVQSIQNYGMNEQKFEVALLGKEEALSLENLESWSRLYLSNYSAK